MQLTEQNELDADFYDNSSPGPAVRGLSEKLHTSKTVGPREYRSLPSSWFCEARSKRWGEGMTVERENETELERER